MAGATTTEQREHFSRLIAEAEESFRRNPAGYRRRLGMLAALGYAYIFGVLIFTLLLIGACVIAAVYFHALVLFLVKSKIIFALVFVFYVLIKSLWVRLGTPAGYPLKRRDCPRLFAEVEDLRKRLKAPKLHRIILTPEFNAAISQSPRLGVFGWQKNTLVLGLSMMLGMDKDQLMSVIAHEFGHLSGNHSRFAGWIYRVRMTWLRIMEAFDQAGGWAHLVFGKFFDWYAPYFNARSFALARANEYEADAVAVAMTSGADFSSALAQAYVAPELMQKHYWSGIERQMRDTPEVNGSVYTGLHACLLTRPFTGAEVDQLLAKAMGEETGDADTHPALKDRIAPFMHETPHPELPEHSAAEELLGDQLPVILQAFDQKWAAYNKEWWRERHAYLQKSREELTRLEQKQAEQELSDEELWNLAAWTEELKPEADPLPAYQQWVQRHPDDPAGNYAVGRILLGRDESAGLVHLDKAMQNYQYTIPACEHAWLYFNGKGEGVRAEEYRLKAERHLDLQHQAQAERAGLSVKDSFEAPGLGKEWIDYLREQCQTVKGLKHVWLCKKQVKIFPESPIYVLIYSNRFWRYADGMDQRIIKALQMPSEYFVIHKEGNHKKIAKKALKAAVKIL